MGLEERLGPEAVVARGQAAMGGYTRGGEWVEVGNFGVLMLVSVPCGRDHAVSGGGGSPPGELRAKY